jgi:CheY-like chemotaxis protein
VSRTIIWIEDDYAVIQPVVYPLIKAGYNIVNIPDTKEAIEKIDQLRDADLILLDLFLPTGTGGHDFGNYPGIQFFRNLRQIHKIDTPVVVFTVLSQASLLTELTELGAADIIRKPVRPSHLKERVERVLERAR